jgi:hypothetical protein
VVVDLATGALDELFALPDLPVAEAGDEGARRDDEHDQEHEQAAPRICSTDHLVRRSLAGRDEEGRAELAQARIECLLADGRLAAQSLHV